MKDRPKLTVGVVVYEENPDNVSGLISDILNQPFDTKIYIIDNSPEPCGVEKFASENVEVIFADANLGYGGGHNIAIQKAIDTTSEYHLVVNPDVRLIGNALEALADFIENNENVGMVIPEVYYPDGSFQYIYKLLPNPFVLFVRMFAGFLPKLLVEKVNFNYEMRFKDFSKPFMLPVVSGCFMFCKTSVLADTGMFDERYFMYFEDVDLSRRVGEKYLNMYVPNVKIVHSFNKQSFKDKRLKKAHLESAFKYFAKWGTFFDRRRRFVNSLTAKND